MLLLAMVHPCGLGEGVYVSVSVLLSADYFSVPALLRFNHVNQGERSQIERGREVRTWSCELVLPTCYVAEEGGDPLM